MVKISTECRCDHDRADMQVWYNPEKIGTVRKVKSEFRQSAGVVTIGQMCRCGFDPERIGTVGRMKSKTELQKLSQMQKYNF